MKSKICKNCRYLREPGFMPDDWEWCSNSKSPLYLKYIYVPKANTCNAFTKKDKKAPLWMRILNKVMK
jgi:hypothetical protein